MRRDLSANQLAGSLPLRWFTMASLRSLCAHSTVLLRLGLGIGFRFEVRPCTPWSTCARSCSCARAPLLSWAGPTELAVELLRQQARSSIPVLPHLALQ